jgi:putative ABC transport system permease protein
MTKMIVANLVHRPIRSLISIFAIAIEVTLILVIVGLSMGILKDSTQRTAGVGADVIVRPPGSSALMSVSGTPVSIKVADVLRKQEHVAAVAPVITQITTGGGTVEVIYGIDYDSFESLGRPFRFLSGGKFQGPNDIIIDDYVAESGKLRVGDTMTVLNQPFRVSGVVEPGKGGRKFLPMATMQELLSAQGKASIFYVKLDDPNQADGFVKQVKAQPGFSGYQVVSINEYISQMVPSRIPGFSAFINVVIGVAVCIGFIVIFQSMYTAVMERTREIGILKSMGASKAYIVGLILRETALLAVVGIIVGITLSFGARAGIINRFPTLRVLMEQEWIIRATVIALIGAVLGALYPAYRAAQKDPIDALAYE